MSINWKACGKK